MFDKLSRVWLELQEANQKILLSTVYREVSDLVSPGQMSDEEQKDRWELIMNHPKKASKEGLALV